MDKTTMDLLLWRHAEAVDGAPDHARPLTERGRRQAHLLAGWIKAHQPKHLRVLVSPTVRTRETARAFTDDFTVVPELAPERGVADLLAATGWPDCGGACLIVGHQPALGRLASLLLSGTEDDWTIRKGALWWLSNRIREGRMQTVLRAAIPHDLV